MLGNILYLHVHSLSDLIAVNQELNPSRFVRVIEEIPVKGGREGEQYMQYKAQSLFDESRIYCINNYLSPFNYVTLEELKNTINDLSYILLPERVSKMNSILDEVDEIIK